MCVYVFVFMGLEEEEDEDLEEDLFVFNDTIEGPRAPAAKPGRVTQEEEEDLFVFNVPGRLRLSQGVSLKAHASDVSLKAHASEGCSVASAN